MAVAGDVLQGKFRIERMLGRGGMGNVYLATDLESSRSVAVKELRPAAGDFFPPGAVRQFRMEAQLLHELRHPNLPQVLDFIEDGGRPFLIMEYIAGRTLDDVLLMDGPVTEARGLDWARQMCDVLAYLHACRPPIIFRDLKPSNVMLTDDGALKLIDFGIAKFFDAETGGATQTSVRGQVSRGYAAPEQYGGGTDAASDIYSLGATLYTIFTREIPPESVDLASGRAALPGIRGARPEISETVERGVARMMSVDRKQRPATADAARALLGLSGARGAVKGALLSPPPAPKRAAEMATGRARADDPVASGHPAEKPRRRAAWLAVAGFLLAVALASLWRPSPSDTAARPGERPGSAVVVRTDPPGAFIRVDGKLQGSSPLTLEGIGAGRHVIHAAKDQHADASETLVLGPGERAQIVLQLKPKTAPSAAARPSPTPAPVARAAPPPVARATPPPVALRPPVAVPSTGANDGLLVPGTRVGALALGTPIAAFQKSAPDIRVTSRAGLPVLVSPPWGMAVAPVGERVGIIVVEDFGHGMPDLKTRGGVRIGAPLGAVVAEFGVPPVTRPLRDQTEWRYPAQGIAFRFRDGAVHTIAIFGAR